MQPRSRATSFNSTSSAVATTSFDLRFELNNSLKNLEGEETEATANETDKKTT